MKTTRSLKAGLLALLLAFGGMGAASADPYRYGHDGYGPPRHYHQDHRGNENVVAALVVAGLVGAAILSSSGQQVPPPVYVAQPAPPVQVAYFCPSVGAYYPNIQSCPGGWQAVAPSPRW